MNVYMKKLKEEFPYLYFVKNKETNEGNIVLVYDSQMKTKTFRIRLMNIDEKKFEEKIYNRLKKDVIKMCKYLSIKGVKVGRNN